eukprot:3780367-Pyramimonas_sp.AAC.1
MRRAGLPPGALQSKPAHPPPRHVCGAPRRHAESGRRLPRRLRGRHRAADILLRRAAPRI